MCQSQAISQSSHHTRDPGDLRSGMGRSSNAVLLMPLRTKDGLFDIVDNLPPTSRRVLGRAEEEEEEEYKSVAGSHDVLNIK